MRRSTPPRAVVALVIAAVMTLGLAACTGSPASSASTGSSAPAPRVSDSSEPDAPGDSGQSKAEACDIIQQSISDATAEFDSAAETDPAAVVETMKAAAAELAAAADRVTNDEVAALVPPLRDLFTNAAEVMQAVVDGDVSKLGDLDELGTQFQQTLTKFQETCSP